MWSQGGSIQLSGQWKIHYFLRCYFSTRSISWLESDGYRIPRKGCEGNTHPWVAGKIAFSQQSAASSSQPKGQATAAAFRWQITQRHTDAGRGHSVSWHPDTGWAHLPSSFRYGYLCDPSGAGLRSTSVKKKNYSFFCKLSFTVKPVPCGAGWVLGSAPETSGTSWLGQGGSFS